MATPQWIIRKGTKRSGFRYVARAGNPVREAAQIARIDALRVPPAWRDVHIAASSTAAIQAWGIDAKGRKQYRYHARAVHRGEQRKYYRVRRLARDLPRILDLVNADLRRGDFTRDAVAAVVVRLIAEGFFRIGGERYARENRTFGIATMLKRHTAIASDMVVFRYVGKRSIRHRQVVVDAELASHVGRLLQTPGARLFRYRSGEAGNGSWCDLTAREVNDYVHRVSGVRYSAKDFRTWGGTLRVATVLDDLGTPHSDREAKRNVVTAVRLVAAELGNTPAICRKSYVHPIVIARYLDAGETIDPRPAAARRARRRAPAKTHRGPEERALIRFLDRYFPERRKRPRPEELVAA